MNACKGFGKEGLKRKRLNQFPLFNLSYVLNFMKQTGASYRDTAIEFKLNNPSLIATWNITFHQEGIEVLKEKPKGRPQMSGKRKSKPSNQEKRWPLWNY
ncbi:hypothetical protein [Halalkalibacillus sediminis]|uniref:hypothetical protein n=1 Tax=Halalkalibacillus sediminis TaxID=2018042 RepID=UPI00117B70C0|nr:hypothetical protein [Halalkalibacillus sediminis]